MRSIARFAFTFALLPLVLAAATAAAPARAATAASLLGPVDYDFVAQANLGAPFQVESGRLAEERAPSAAVRDYARLMVVTHIPVVDALNAILRRKGVTAPPETLLHGAYEAMIATLTAERGAGFERDYVGGQVEYQKGNAALFRGEIRQGSDPELRAFARQTLPKIEDHLQRALRLAAAPASD